MRLSEIWRRARYELGLLDVTKDRTWHEGIWHPGLGRPTAFLGQSKPPWLSPRGQVQALERAYGLESTTDDLWACLVAACETVPGFYQVSLDPAAARFRLWAPRVVHASLEEIDAVTRRRGDPLPDRAVAGATVQFSVWSRPLIYVNRPDVGEHLAHEVFHFAERCWGLRPRDVRESAAEKAAETLALVLRGRLTADAAVTALTGRPPVTWPLRNGRPR